MDEIKLPNPNTSGNGTIPLTNVSGYICNRWPVFGLVEVLKEIRDTLREIRDELKDRE